MIKIETTRRTKSIIAGVVVATVVIAFGFALAGQTAGGNPAAIEAAVRGAIEARQSMFKLPPGFVAGRITPDQRRQLVQTMQGEFARYTAGGALTNEIANAAGWLDRISNNAQEGWLLSSELVSLDMGEPVVDGGTATVVGTYVLMQKQAYGLPDGRTATYGGRYTQRYAFQLETRGSRWVVVDYTDQPVDFVPDPSMESNLDVDPAPDETKPPLTND